MSLARKTKHQSKVKKSKADQTKEEEGQTAQWLLSGVMYNERRIECSESLLLCDLCFRGLRGITKKKATGLDSAGQLTGPQRFSFDGQFYRTQPTSTTAYTPLVVVD